MKTDPIYLQEPYETHMEGQILTVIADQPGVWRLILDRTVFYPMGGGQPTDQGKITFTDGTEADVFQVQLKDGEINHFVKMGREPQPGEQVKGSIDWDRRYKHMRLHSAGHVVDFALHLLGYSPNRLKPLKGDHGKKPVITYGGTIEEDFKAALQTKTDELLNKNLKFSWGFKPLEEIQKNAIYLQPGLPANKPLRALSLEGVGTVADGGTIVKSTEEIGKITITAIETKEGNTLIKYVIE